MTNLFNELVKLLEANSLYISDDGSLMKNKVVEAGLALNPELIKLLLEHDGLRRNFFVEIEGVTVFDKVKFQKFIMNKRFLPDSYTSFKNKIGLTNEEGDFLADSRDVVLSFPYKDCVLEGGQTKEDAKRNEVFWNEILAPDEITRLLEPKVLTNFKRYTVDGEKEVNNVSIDDNLIIKGNNLLALHTLKAKYAGKVKLIYIDPPYNTGNDGFQYNDSFNHSSWLTFMRNRISIAETLLHANGGVICIQCDDNESAYLKVLCDDILGINNFISTVIVKSSTPSGLKTAHKDKTIIKTKDHIHMYKKGEISINPLYVQRTEWDTHFSNYLDKENLTIRSLVDVLVENNIINKDSKLKDISLQNKSFHKFYIEHMDRIFQTQPVMPEEHKEASKKLKDKVYRYKVDKGYNYAINGRRCSFLSESVNRLENNEVDLGLLLCDLWNDIDFQNTQNEGGISFPGGKKPEKLIQRIINLFTDTNDIVLDYHLGSGTTAAVAHKMGRRYIGVEQMDYIETVAVERLKHVVGITYKDGMFDKISFDEGGISKSVKWQGGGEFVYCELATANQSYVDSILKSDTKDDLINIWNQIQGTGFLSWKINPNEINENISDFTALDIDDMKKFLIESLDKNMLYVPFSEIDNSEFQISDSDKKINKDWYSKK